MSNPDATSANWRPLRRARVLLGHTLRRQGAAQILLLILFWGIAHLIVGATHLPIPAGVLGLLMTSALLFSKRLSILDIRRGADSLIEHMMLFFIPAALILLDMPQLLGLPGLKLLIAMIVGTSLVMLATALCVFLLHRLWPTRES